jgi:hypothetical protein
MLIGLPDPDVDSRREPRASLWYQAEILSLIRLGCPRIRYALASLIVSPLVFNGYVHEALVHAFRDIGGDGHHLLVSERHHRVDAARTAGR